MPKAKITKKHNPKTQADRIIAKFGGPHALCDIFTELKMPRNITTIFRWTYPYGQNGGTGGLIPLSAILDVIAAAKAKKITLTAEDFDPRES